MFLCPDPEMEGRMKFGISILAVALLLGGCATRGLTSAELMGPNNVGGLFHSEPGGALIYGEDGTAWGVAPPGASHSSLQKDWHFQSPEAGKQGVVISVTAVWASGAKKTYRIRITTDQPISVWTFSRPMDAAGLDIDLRQAQSQTPPQSQDQNFNAADALAAFGRGWAQAQAASAANKPIFCTSTNTNGIINTLCN
jgi:hypothetical protein